MLVKQDVKLLQDSKNIVQILNTINQLQSTVAQQHVLDNDHFNITRHENLKLLKNVNNTTKLNAWESLHIHKNRFNLMNFDKGPIKSSLFYFT